MYWSRMCVFVLIHFPLLIFSLAGNCPENRANDNTFFTINHCVWWHKSIHIMIQSICVCVCVFYHWHQSILSSVSVSKSATAGLDVISGLLRWNVYLCSLFLPSSLLSPVPSLPSFSIPSQWEVGEKKEKSTEWCSSILRSIQTWDKFPT